MKNLCDPAIDKYRIPHPMGQVPDELRPYVGAFMIPAGRDFSRGHLGVIASRGGEIHKPEPGWDWDHVSVSRPDRCPTWTEMCWIKDLFFRPDEVAMQLHPVDEYINNHPFCLHLWRPITDEIPLPPSILVGLKEFKSGWSGSLMSGGLHHKLAASHPKLQRGQVWCRRCRSSLSVESANCMRTGWPKCCGYTMTIDPPEEWR